MKRFVFSYLVVAVVFVSLISIMTTSCKDGNKDDDGMKKITMTSHKSGNLVISIAGSGSITIDWGDGTESEEHTLSLFTGSFGREHEYSHHFGASARTITITGENIAALNIPTQSQLTSLDVSGCRTLTYLQCSYNELISLKISNNNKALAYLYCHDNQLTSLDVSGCTALTKLDCCGNKLTSLKVNGCTALEWLSCFNNQLTSLDLSGCTALTTLVCHNNLITSLDLSICRELTELYCYNNQLKSLNVGGCTALRLLGCQNNQLTSLNVSGCTALIQLGCENNQLTGLNMSGCSALAELSCAFNKLTSLNVSDCTMLSLLACYRNQFINTALNAFFETLHNNNTSYGNLGHKIVLIGDNPGTNDCDRSIAMKKGWVVLDLPY